ncbi:MAG TPA: PAS domain-containing protein, partial [Patescibacteria group bacterium]|nr:PAS domain-containing protein [Patescibacteria group bacterium]
MIGRVADLQSRLSEAEDTLNAIRSGSIDALVVRTPRGEQLFTLKGADQTYRALVEAMNEGALTLHDDTISYCNHHLARLARAPLQQIIGQSILPLIPSPDFHRMLRLLQDGKQVRGSLEAVLRTTSGAEVPVLISACSFDSNDKTSIG